MVRLRTPASEVSDVIRTAAWPLLSSKAYDHIASWVGDARIVLLGEDTAGTHDFFGMRAMLTRRLIETCGFTAVAVEADWSDAHAVNRFVHGLAGRDAAAAIQRSAQFPQWRWRNTAVSEFATWLARYNLSRPEPQRVSVYGLDLHSLHASIRDALAWLRQGAPERVALAREYFAAFDQFAEEPNESGARLPSDAAAWEALVAHLLRQRGNRADWLRNDGPRLPDEGFYAAQHEVGHAGASEFYRLLLADRLGAWNARTRHLARMLDDICEYLATRRREPKVVVWATNRQVGDARATEQLARGETSLGQLAREGYSDAVRSIGLMTHRGAVASSIDWGAEATVRTLEPALPDSPQAMLHEVGLPPFFLPLDRGADLRDLFLEKRPQRSVGLVYRPEQERWTHYFEARLADQFDAVVYSDVTHALEPMETLSEWVGG
jgi:erythromycin esterase-like protein